MDRLDWIRAVAAALLCAVLTNFGFHCSPPPVKPAEVEKSPKKKPAPPAEEDEEDVTPKPKSKPKKPADEEVEQAVGRVQFPGGGCTLCPIHPRNPDGTWDCLCAAHCVRRPGDIGGVALRDGTRFTVKVITFDRAADVSWCRTEKPLVVPALILAEKTPPVGSAVWHCGFGRDKPGNIERGKLTGTANSRGRNRYWLSASPGDSGGPIIDAATQHVLSPVCCTDTFDGVGNVFGACPEACRALRRGLDAPRWSTPWLSLASPIGLAPFHRV